MKKEEERNSPHPQPERTMALKGWRGISFIKQPDQHYQQNCRGVKVSFLALCGCYFMEHPDFLDVFSLVQDYLKHVVRERGTCDAPPSKVAEVLRKVGSSLQKEVESHLRPCLDLLKIRSVDEASRIFSQVMDEEFADGNTNWGRILTIFVFGGILAEKLQGQGATLGEKNLEQISHFMTEYIIKTKATWISENGGWEDGFVARFEEKTPWLSVHNVKATLASVFSFFSQYY